MERPTPKKYYNSLPKLISSDGKRYSVNSLSNDAKEILLNLTKAEAIIENYKEKISIITIGNNQLKLKIKSLLKDQPEIKSKHNIATDSKPKKSRREGVKNFIKRMIRM
tara:strand:- start:18 stop:344 length:327 start_codon:yes stop_codon:yes gene_type:complete